MVKGFWNKWKSGLSCSVFHQELKNTHRNQNHRSNTVKGLSVFCSLEQEYQRHKTLIQQTVTVPRVRHFYELFMDRENASHPHGSSEIYAYQEYWFDFLTVQTEPRCQTDMCDKALLQQQTRARGAHELTWVMTTGFSFKMGSCSKSWAKLSVPSPPKPLANAVMAGKTALGRSSHFTKPSMNPVRKEL